MKRKYRFIISLGAFFFVCFIFKGNAREKKQGTDLFRKNEQGYNCFRIPAFTLSSSGTILAFAEGRKKSCSDTGDIDIVLRRSEDGGKTWGNPILVWDAGDDVCGNPVPVVDKNTGRIHLLCCWNLGEDHEREILNGKSKDTRKVFRLYSDDDGLTWSAPQDITPSVKDTAWTWYATGPCHAIQLQDKKYRNRLVVPANHMVAGTKAFHSHVIYSDDAGETWRLGGVVATPGGNESTVVELSDGSLMLNMRNYTRDKGRCRSFALSSDGGVTWGPVQYADDLEEPVCQASIVNYMKKGKTTKRLLFSNPASTDKRECLTIKQSNDNGKSWTSLSVVYPGPSAYSDLLVFPDGDVGILYEYGVNNPYENIRFERLSVSE